MTTLTDLSKAQTIHATALYKEGCGILLLGPSGSGKSDLALRLIMERRACLVADDVCEIVNGNKGLVVRGPKEGARLLEVRGLGIAQLRPDQWASQAPLTFALRLTPHAQIARHPSGEVLEDLGIPIYPLDPFQLSALAKIRLLIQVHREEARLLWPEQPLARAS